MRRLLLTLVVFVFSSMAAAGIYRSVDSQGNVVYSDRPGSNAEEVDLPKLQLYPAPPMPPEAVTATPREPEQKGYATLAITAPADDATIIDNSGSVVVMVSLNPGLRAAEGDRLVLLVDGERSGEPFTATSVKLTNLDRGTHTLQVQAVDRDGQTLTESATVTFHLRRHSLLQKKK